MEREDRGAWRRSSQGHGECTRRVGCSSDHNCASPLAQKKKRTTSRGCGERTQASSDAIPLRLVDNAVDAQGDWSECSPQILSSTAQTDRPAISEATADTFWDAEDDLPFDVLEEVLSRYDKPVGLLNENGCTRETPFHRGLAPQDHADSAKCGAAESLSYGDHTAEECAVCGESTPGFPAVGQPVSKAGGSSGKDEEALDDCSGFRDGLMVFDEESRGARRETGSELDERPWGVFSGSDGSFKDAFYEGGTDWSALHDVDEYGLPRASSPPSASSDHVGGRDFGKVVKPQPSTQSHAGLLEPGLCSKAEEKRNPLDRSSRLKQGDLSSFLGLKRKQPSGAEVSQKRTEQRDIGTYFGLAPLADSPAKRRPRFTPPGAPNGPRKGWKGNREPARECPFYKKMPGTPFTVDAFKFGAVEGCKAYFLSHFHSDHYGGLTRSWCHGPIFCTEITARLVSMHLGVDPQWLRPVKLDSLFFVEGVGVEFLEANHCPGAALILFQTHSGQRILHTGDFRACKAMQGYPDLLTGRITSLYLDTTYCNPKYNFPLQEDVIQHVVRLTAAALARNPRTLVTVGAYSIGKERVYLGIAKALRLPIYADKRRARTLRCLDWPDLAERLCADATDSRLHVLPISHLNAAKLRAYLQSLQPAYSAVLAFRPTGWTYSDKIGSKLQDLKPQCSGAVTIYGVPYSEHSSFSELQEFVQFLRPQKIIATVNVGSAAQRDSMQAWFNQWLKC